MPSLKGALKDQSGSRPRLPRFSLNQAPTGVQIALSTLLLIGAGLFVRTLQNLQSVQLGFNRENILLFKVNARQAGHRDPGLTTFYRNLQPGIAPDSASTGVGAPGPAEVGLQ